VHGRLVGPLDIVNSHQHGTRGGQRADLRERGRRRPGRDEHGGADDADGEEKVGEACSHLLNDAGQYACYGRVSTPADLVTATG
jgi:hypothetical protein